LIVITNSVKILNEFDWPSSISVISTGGYLQRQWSALGGAIALDSLSRLNFDQIFISCGGVSIDRGVMTSFTFIVEILRKASGIAREVNLMVDNSKFSKVGTYTIMPVTTLKRIITDEKISQQVADQYRGLGIGVDF
jgi:DeoR/GlpR family transcriptional regulator of sugar metabolism